MIGRRHPDKTLEPTRMPPRAAVRAALGARRVLQRAADRVVPAEVAVFDHSTGFGATFILGALAELGIADRLAGGLCTAAELAAELECDEDALHRVLRASAVFDFVRLDRQGRFHATRLTRAVRTGTPRAVREWCLYISERSTIDAWQDLQETMRTGKNGFRRVHGMSTWEWFSSHPDEERTFAAAMRGLTEAEAPGIVAAYPFPETGSVCDIAGGIGTLLGHVLLARPGLEGVLVDGPGVLEEATAHLESVGVRDRVTLVEGDIFQHLGANADLYLMKNVLHDWNDEACQQILTNVAGTMPVGSRLVIIEGAIERNQAHPFMALADLQMMMVCEEGRERSIGELQALLRAAGLLPGDVRRTPTDLALAEGVKQS